jgi:hypothetical protein
MLLTQQENGSGGKSDTLPEVWFANKSDEYLDMHLIPNDKSLWTLERFEDFIKARKSLIHNKFAYLLSTIQRVAEDPANAQPESTHNNL